jgi:hypothetical protein
MDWQCHRRQAATKLTNVDDIESFMKGAEAEKGVCYLQAIDLAKSDRRRVMNELAYHGYYRGSLFPGLDGACEELVERNFERT